MRALTDTLLLHFVHSVDCLRARSFCGIPASASTVFLFLRTGPLMRLLHLSCASVRSQYTFVPPLTKPCECVRSKDWENDALIVYSYSMQNQRHIF